MIDRLAFGAVAVALASVLVLDGTFGANLHRAFGPNPMPDLAGWQVGVVCAPLAYVATARLTRAVPWPHGNDPGGPFHADKFVPKARDGNSRLHSWPRGIKFTVHRAG